MYGSLSNITSIIIGTNINILSTIAPTKLNYNAKLKIGSNELLLNYGSYHHLYLNTNEQQLYIETYPYNNVIIELWTGYHLGQGRKTTVEGTTQTTLSNIGIIRSINIIPSNNSLSAVNINKININNNNNNNNNMPDITNTVRQDYVKHITIRDPKDNQRFSDFTYISEPFMSNGHTVQMSITIWLIFLLCIYFFVNHI